MQRDRAIEGERIDVRVRLPEPAGSRLDGEHGGDLAGRDEGTGEELDELAWAETEAERVEEAGDLLFAVVNFLRSQKIAPEDALRAANAKFERRFRAMENRAEGDFSALTLDQQDALWNAVKRSEANITP